jgi:hypothetical protein
VLRCGTGEADVCASAALSEAGACPLARAGQARSPANNAYMNQQLTMRQRQNAALMSQPQSQALPDPVPAPSLQMVPYNPGNPGRGRGSGRGRGGRGRGGRGGRGRGGSTQCYACGELGHTQHHCPMRGVG